MQECPIEKCYVSEDHCHFREDVDNGTMSNIPGFSLCSIVCLGGVRLYDRTAPTYIRQLEIHENGTMCMSECFSPRRHPHLRGHITFEFEIQPE